MAVNEIICTAISAASAILVAILTVYIKRYEDRAERDSKFRERQMLLLLRMVDSAISLSIVSANALMDYKNNGNVAEAYESAAEAKKEYKQMMQELTAQQASK